MLTISDIRALAKNRFDGKYEKMAAIVIGLTFAWFIIAAACQGFATMDKTFTYAVPDSVVKTTGNSVNMSYGLSNVSFNDYNLTRTSDKDIEKGNVIFVTFGFIVPLVVFCILGCMYSYKKDRYVMVFQQKWLETGLVPDMDKI
jgi:hypothetical protein